MHIVGLKMILSAARFIIKLFLFPSPTHLIIYGPEIPYYQKETLSFIYKSSCIKRYRVGVKEPNFPRGSLVVTHLLQLITHGTSFSPVQSTM